MKVPQILLFSLRLFFYLSVVTLILVHPAISVSFDRIGMLQWFVIIPLMSIIAFLPRFNLRNKFIIAPLALISLSIWAGGFGPEALQPFITGLISFTLTFLLFYYPRWGKLSVFEPFFLAWVALRLLTLSRSGEDIAGQSLVLTQFILVWTIAVFLFHNVVVYFCLYPRSSGGAGKEGAVFILSAITVLILVLAVLPPDFVRNTIIGNLLLERVPERIADESNRGMPMDSNGRRAGRRTIPLSGETGRPGLRGISEHNWHNRTGRGRGGGEDNRQYMVMIVASDREPVYMGDSFRGHLDPVEGFLISPQETMNQLVNQRFFVTWQNSEWNNDMGRRRQEVFSLSTLPQKYLPWRPLMIDPTILNENSGPLRYIHQVVSSTHLGDPLRLVNVPSRPFSNSERAALAPYLDFPLIDSDREAFSVYLNNTLEWWQHNREAIIRNNSYLWEIFSSREENLEPANEHLEIILALLLNFSNYQYNLSYNDNYNIAALKEFLFITAEGDCVEFSNSFALLGRLAGIPSRVVTGYLAAEGLQTIAHFRGLATLQERIPVLQNFPFDNLFMVTNLHSHSWTQFYIPGYGWLDFEATSFSLPPVGTGDFNTWDVVIPLLDQERTFSQVRKFPWLAVGRAAIFLAILTLVCAYVLRYGREIILYFGSQAGGRAGARSLYLLLLAHLAADGKPVKPASKTAHEYSQLFPGAGENPHFMAFASIYSELRWREFGDRAELDKRFELLKQEYKEILNSTRRRGIHRWFIRIISLRGLAYL